MLIKVYFRLCPETLFSFVHKFPAHNILPLFIIDALSKQYAAEKEHREEEKNTATAREEGHEKIKMIVPEK